jgi:hypothetical protein
MGANSSVPLREDVLRGLRWGMILLIAMLIAIAGYRMFGTTPATAAPKIEVAPAPVPTAPEPAIQAGEGAPSEAARPISGPDVPAAPPPKRRQAAPIEPDDHAKAFIPPAVTTPRTAVKQDLTESLPDVPSIDVKAEPVASPTPQVETKQQEKGSRAGKLARSVGRVFGFGRKDASAPAK